MIFVEEHGLHSEMIESLSAKCASGLRVHKTSREDVSLTGTIDPWPRAPPGSQIQDFAPDPPKSVNFAGSSGQQLRGPLKMWLNKV